MKKQELKKQIEDLKAENFALKIDNDLLKSDIIILKKKLKEKEENELLNAKIDLLKEISDLLELKIYGDKFGARIGDFYYELIKLKI